MKNSSLILKGEHPYFHINNEVDIYIINELPEFLMLTLGYSPYLQKYGFSSVWLERAHLTHGMCNILMCRVTRTWYSIRH